jgi:hypothetical protein
MSTSHSNIPLACDMNVFTPSERELHVQTTQELLQSVKDIRAAENGYEFSFPNTSEILAGAAEFISKERLCCPFLEFTMRVSPYNEPISLLLTGPEGTQEFLRLEFSEAFVPGGHAR